MAPCNYRPGRAVLRNRDVQRIPGVIGHLQALSGHMSNNGQLHSSPTAGKQSQDASKSGEESSFVDGGH